MADRRSGQVGMGMAAQGSAGQRRAGRQQWMGIRSGHGQTAQHDSRQTSWQAGSRQASASAGDIDMGIRFDSIRFDSGRHLHPQGDMAAGQQGMAGKRQKIGSRAGQQHPPPFAKNRFRIGPGSAEPGGNPLSLIISTFLYLCQKTYYEKTYDNAWAV